MIHIFWHICTINHWQLVVTEQLARLKKSGLYQAAESIQCGVVGAKEFIPEDKKIQIIYRDSNRGRWEWPTLIAMREFCLKSPNAKVLYFHTKGISKRGRGSPITKARMERLKDWRYLMEYFLIDHFQDCITLLDEVDVCGINFRGGGGQNSWRFRVPHFAGNFWWAKGSFVAGLPIVTPEMARERVDAEFWVGHGEGRVACLYESKANHCLSAYPESLYSSGGWTRSSVSLYQLKDKIRRGVV